MLLANVKPILAPMPLTIFIKIRKIVFWEEHVLVMTNARLCPIATLTQVKTCANYFMKNISRYLLNRYLKIWTENFTKFHFMNHPYYGVDSWHICTLWWWVAGTWIISFYSQKLHIKIYILRSQIFFWQYWVFCPFLKRSLI